MSGTITTLDALYPEGTFFCARTTRDMMRWNVANVDALAQYRLDATPAQLAGFAGTMPFVAHEASMTPLAMDFIRHCGLPGADNLLSYRTEQDAVVQARQLIRSGGRLVHNFGTLPPLEQDDGLLISLVQYLRLNSKTAIDEFVADEHLPARQIVTVSALEDCLAASSGPVFVKVGEDVSTGGGAGVWYCPDSETAAKVSEAVAVRLPAACPIVVEADCTPRHSWCAGVSVLDDRVIWLGASRQVFHAPARQAGNEFIGDAPDEVRELTLSIARQAGKTGYRGIAGFDIGELEDGRCVVFDLNFRPNSSTGLLLAGKAAMQRTGLALAKSFFLRHDGPLGDLLDAVEPEAAAGRIIPGSVFDAETYKQTCEDAATRSCLDGWMLADCADAVAASLQTITGRLSR